MKLETLRFIALLGCFGGIAVTSICGCIVATLSNPIEVSGFTFNVGTGGTYRLPTFSEPRDLGDNNIIFPRFWSYLQRARWREENNKPGAEWPNH